jgi:hypothetical protein
MAFVLTAEVLTLSKRPIKVLPLPLVSMYGSISLQ